MSLVDGSRDVRRYSGVGDVGIGGGVGIGFCPALATSFPE